MGIIDRETELKQAMQGLYRLLLTSHLQSRGDELVMKSCRIETQDDFSACSVENCIKHAQPK